MKKIILGMLVLLSFGCSLYDVTADAFYESKIQRVAVYYHEDFLELQSIDDIVYYVNTHVTYKSEEADVWSTAKETLTRGYGDCEDFAILFMNIYYVMSGIKLDVASSYRYVVGGLVGHLFVVLEPHILLSPQSGRIDRTSTINNIYSFDLFFY